MAKVNVDVKQLPAGLSREEFEKLPEIKAQKSWFTWAGVVGIVSGLMGMASLGQANELKLQGYMIDMTPYAIFALISVIGLVLGILLIIKKSTKIAYGLGAVCIIAAIMAIASGGSVGFGFVATILALLGAVKVDKLWKEYQGA